MRLAIARPVLKQIYIKLVVFCQLFALVPGPGAVKAMPAPPVPHQAYVYKKVAELPVSDFEYAQTLELLPTPESTAAASNSQSSTDNMPQAAGCGDNAYANYIYMHESGCNTSATNSIGCYGIGQDCNGIVRARCGSNYACQNDYFTQYTSAAYGSWAAAYQHWLAYSWW